MERCESLSDCKTIFVSLHEQLSVLYFSSRHKHRHDDARGNQLLRTFKTFCSLLKLL